MLDEERKQELHNYTIESNYVGRVNPIPDSLLTSAENAQIVCTLRMVPPLARSSMYRALHNIEHAL